jgi:hypothetical protein
MNGDVFSNFNKLQEVRLKGNQCIDHDFKDKSVMNLLPQIASEKCGYCEQSNDLTNCEMLNEFKKTEERLLGVLEDQKNENKQTKLELVTFRKVLTEFIKLSGNSETTINDKFNIELKSSENEKLQEEVQKLKVAVDSKDREIEKLKKKIDNFVFENEL